ncbi:MAG: hypothetical protein QF918_05115 [Pirellulaceae bacterium]|nr:hypothetical protein [Pirellulaceae bacterium]MDP6553177.1 hypothetical protein [Pirellulaceae bacterium]MDP6723427.1 hypothetical protein [Pirellulaceae bacterium]
MTRYTMSKSLKPIVEMAKQDGRYHLDAYLFVQQALVFAEFELDVGRPRPYGVEGEFEPGEVSEQSHLTGQQLCEACRQYAQEMYGLMATVVLKNWKVTATRDFGEIVYNLIEIGEMTKSETDRREDFDNVYDFEEVFQRSYVITMADDS